MLFNNQNYNVFQLFQVLLKILLYVDDQFMLHLDIVRLTIDFLSHNILNILSDKDDYYRFVCPWIDQRNKGYHT